MAIVITNGEYYIYLNEQGKHRKTKDISQALQYKSVREAIDYMYKAPAKTKGFYVYDTFTNRVIWKRLVQQEIIELQEQKNGITNITRKSDGKIKRKHYSPTTRKLIYDNCGGRCQLCGRKLLLKDMSLDHIKPLSMGGVDDVSNLTCTCVPCNRFKANMAPHFFNNRINEIFLYQMKKGSRGKILQKVLYMFVARYAKENYTY